MKFRNFWDSRLKVPTVGIIVVEVVVFVVYHEDDNEDDNDGGGGVEDDDVDEGVDDDVDDSGVGQTDFMFTKMPHESDVWLHFSQSWTVGLGVEYKESNDKPCWWGITWIMYWSDFIKNDMETHQQKLTTRNPIEMWWGQDQRFLDLCDEHLDSEDLILFFLFKLRWCPLGLEGDLTNFETGNVGRHGILVWEETTAWQPNLDDLQDETFLTLQVGVWLEGL